MSQHREMILYIMVVWVTAVGSEPRGGPQVIQSKETCAQEGEMRKTLMPNRPPGQQPGEHPNWKSKHLLVLWAGSELPSSKWPRPAQDIKRYI